jgi:predicted secreted hydrolase
VLPRSLLPVLLAVLLIAGCGPTKSASSVGSRSGPLVHLPADAAAHPNAHNEWWYVVGHLHGGGRTFGYELTIFKFLNIKPPGSTVPVTLYRTDAAITDETGKAFYQHVSYYFPQSAHLSSSRMNARVGPDSIAGPSSHIRVSSALPNHVGGVNLTLVSHRTPMYVGGRGYLPFANQFTYYYSLTDLTAHGTVALHGRRYAVSGISWLDHQWGSWNWTTVKGWTWMALQLSNGVQLSVFDFRSTKQRVRAASVSTPNGATLTERPVTITSMGRWRSPHTGGVYPSGWVVRIPGLHAVFHIRPAVRDQELAVPGQSRGSYWEGSGYLTGTYRGTKVSGRTYTELTGYAGSGT